MRSIFEHTQENILVIPQGLFAMRDVHVLYCHKDSIICRKQLEHDLVDVEFYTNRPCFIYIERGSELLTDSDNHNVELNSGSAVFLPQGMNLHSDFVKHAHDLQAYLVFFDPSVIDEYLSRSKPSETNLSSEGFFNIEDNQDLLKSYFQSLCYDINEADYMHVKLLELLHVISYLAGPKKLTELLLGVRKGLKRNLERLLASKNVIHLTVTDLAQLSGRSLSSLNRDFKALYKVTPQKWLRDKKLAHAMELLNNHGFSVTQTANEVGYDNVSQFSRAFKLRYGLSPRQIKNGQMTGMESL
ncbi:helix-turn-helix transcriptional regulator [Vibrio sp. RE88]|uniref:helix-turn-helix domain-containing protein n=1 Tax=Vibrio sp. RE88 TaxID=2607610 RepID=UPI001493B170|nr:helix-turn-helix transcriptional regulator [Vibrio sp. RE88]NOH63517.1 helix-turn-helix transcriptional regulator [Vibrio sp. RE88]